MNFWQKLFERGWVLGLSPMDGVTDAPFRYMVAKYGSRESSNPQIGGVDVMFTEFISTDGLHFAAGEKKERMLKAFVKARDCDKFFGSKTSPHNFALPYEVAQVFGNNPEFFAEAAELIESLGFDGIDINMGCPAKNVSEHGCGAGLIRTPELAQKIVKVTQCSTSLPVSVKTRVGVTSVTEMEEWIAALCEVKPAVISLHGRTLKQMYTGEADWEAIRRSAELAHAQGIKLLGNGDIKSVHSTQHTVDSGELSAEEAVERYGVDGVLIGRAAEGNPGIFRGQKTVDSGQQMSEQRLAWAVEHAYVYEKVFKPDNANEYDVRWFLPMRKHLAWYVHGFAGASELRMKMMKTRSADEVGELVNELLSSQK